VDRDWLPDVPCLPAALLVLLVLEAFIGDVERFSGSGGMRRWRVS
jgi:hypothetical protein